MLSSNLKVGTMPDGRIIVVNVQESDAPVLAKYSEGKLLPTKDGKKCFMYKYARKSEVEEFIARHRPLVLDWHDEKAIEEFGDKYLSGREIEYLRRLLPQLLWEERGEGKASVSSHRLAEKLAAGEMLANVVKWLREEAR